MMAKQNINTVLIAPCGMNCSLCTSYLAYTHEIPKSEERLVIAADAGQK